MKSKTLFLTYFGILLTTISLAQKKKNVYFLKNNGAAVSFKDSADYIRVIQEPDSGTTYFNLLEYYPNGVKKRIGKLSSFDPNLIYEGTLVSYHSNGKRKEITTYARGKTKGIQYNYYPNGQLKKSSINEAASKNSNALDDTKIIDYYDSTGVQLIKDGTGYYKAFEEDRGIIEEGNYIDSVKHGMWKGSFTKVAASYTEQYDHGKFIEGESKLNDDSSNKYTKIDEMPSFKGGINKFLEYVARNYTYPREAVESRITGKVIVSFVVERDGSLTNIILYECNCFFFR